MKTTKDNEDISDKPARKNTTLWLCIIFFVSAWMFVLGVLVGRGTAPVHFDIESLQKELAGLKEAMLQKEQQWYNYRSQTAPEHPELEFHEALKRNGAEPRLDSETTGSGKPPVETRKILPQENKSPAARAPQSVEIPDNQAGASGSAGAASDFTIQVAALKEANFADTKVAALSQKGYPAYRVTGTAPGQGTWYRVRIGSFKDRTEATRMLERLKKENITGIIVRK